MNEFNIMFVQVTGMSVLTEGLGLSNTLGAFLAGVLLSETKYKYQV
jgi:monovalent cation:H+ antiporter-2, CPA2 family